MPQSDYSSGAVEMPIQACRSSGLRGRSFTDWAKGVGQLGKFVGRDVPQQIEVDPVVRVGEDHPRGDQLAPRDFWILGLRVVPELRGGLTSNFDSSLQCHPQDRVGLNCIPPAFGQVSGDRAHAPDVVEPLRCDSQADSVLADVLVLGEQAPCRDNVDIAAQQLLEVHLQSGQVEQRGTDTELDEEVEVAARCLLAPSH